MGNAAVYLTDELQNVSMSLIQDGKIFLPQACSQNQEMAQTRINSDVRGNSEQGSNENSLVLPADLTASVTSVAVMEQINA